MKKLYFLFALSCLSQFSYAQLRMGVLGGPQSANVKENNSIPGWESDIKPGYSAKSGLHLGVLLELPLSQQPGNRWFLQPGIIYSAKGRKYYQRYDTANAVITDTFSASNNLSANYIDIPVNITYKIPLSKKANFTVGAGPYISFFYNGKQKFETRFADLHYLSEDAPVEAGKAEGKVNTFDAGFNARAGFEIGSFMVTGFLSQGLTNFYHAPYDGTFKHQVKGVSIGFWLGKPKKPAPVVKPAEPIIVKTDTVATPVMKDSDGDGIRDEEDLCPNEAGVAEFNGCPVTDMDGDGVNDLEDKCPQEAGPASNHGCPDVKPDTIARETEEKISFAAKNILFGASSDKLTQSSFAGLDEVVSVMKAHPSYKLTIHGHTDASGKPEQNKKLSQQRADAVKHYLVSKGIEEHRLEAEGFGSEKPLADDKTKAGRAVNRRVELRLAR